MLKQLEKEAEEEEEIYDQLACWCETNDKEKTKAIADAEAKITDLTTKIEELTANSARLNTEIKNLEKEVAENQQALDKATALRQKELAEFNAEEKDVLQSIAGLKAALTALSKHHEELMQTSGAFLQTSTSQMKSIAATVQEEMQKHAPQSGEIFGILNQMKETFETNLANSQKEETTDQKSYLDLKSGKEAQISSANKMIAKKS